MTKSCGRWKAVLHAQALSHRLKSRIKRRDQNASIHSHLEVSTESVLRITQVSVPSTGAGNSPGWPGQSRREAAQAARSMNCDERKVGARWYFKVENEVESESIWRDVLHFERD